MESVRKRKNLTNSNKGKGIFHSEKENGHKGGSEESGKTNRYRKWLLTISTLVGLIAMLYCAYYHTNLVSTLHENNLWFTNIREVEREISFRTEAGLYYSYYKQMVGAPSVSQGLHELMNDKLTEYPDTINILERMNVYQEVFLAMLYRILPIQENAIFFYIKSVFALQGVLVAALFVMTWLLANSWLAGTLAAAFYIFNKLDTTRVSYAIALRESFALPFIWIQAAAFTYYFRPTAHGWKKTVSVVVMGVSTFLFCLFWQFNQFVMLLQAFALFGVWILDILPAGKVKTAFMAQVASLLAVCLLQFFNEMILGSLVLSFIPATFLLMFFKGSMGKTRHWLLHAGRVVMYSVLALILMVVINNVIKFVLRVEADEHIFKFLMNKFSGEETRDFDSLLYLCLSIFGFLTMDVYLRLTGGFVLPFYIFAHTCLLFILLGEVIDRWRNHTIYKNGKEKAEKNDSDEQSKKKENDEAAMKKERNLLMNNRPELVFHAVQCFFFGGLAITTLRMKYLWTPYMCVFAAVLVGDKQLWASILSYTKSKGSIWVDIYRHASLALVLASLLWSAIPHLTNELEELKEFWDPDTVALMEWIKESTPPMASFSGSMQLMAGVKLCTGHPINNHPHYEDKHLRHKTKQLYQVYGRRTPEDVHAILKSLESHYIILEDSICLSPSQNNCRTPDIIDLDNGIIPDGGEAKPGLQPSSVPRFCVEVRHQKPEYAKYFKKVFVNKTFIIYKVL